MQFNSVAFRGRSPKGQAHHSSRILLSLEASGQRNDLVAEFAPSIALSRSASFTPTTSETHLRSYITLGVCHFVVALISALSPAENIGAPRGTSEQHQAVFLETNRPSLF
jgi:hypothetical protein